MTKAENLMMTAMEECAEIQQAFSKAMRFGMDNRNPLVADSATNMQNILTEYYQLTAVMQMLFENGVLEDISDDKKAKIIQSKKEKVKQHQAISRHLNLMTNNISTI